MPTFLAVVVGVLVLLIIIGNVSRKKKGGDTPESLKEYFSLFIDVMDNVGPLPVIFKFHSNDGNQIVYKEITVSRNCFLKIERYKLIISCLDDSGNETYFAEHSNVANGLTDKEIVEVIHGLYTKMSVTGGNNNLL